LRGKNYFISLVIVLMCVVRATNVNFQQSFKTDALDELVGIMGQRQKVKVEGNSGTKYAGK